MNHATRSSVANSTSSTPFQGEFFSVAFRRTFYESVDQLQRDLDRYLEFYNRERAHQGYRTKGRTPFQAFLDGVAAMRPETEATPEAA